MLGRLWWRGSARYGERTDCPISGILTSCAILPASCWSHSFATSPWFSTPSNPSLTSRKLCSTVPSFREVEAMRETVGWIDPKPGQLIGHSTD